MSGDGIPVGEGRYFRSRLFSKYLGMIKPFKAQGDIQIWLKIYPISLKEIMILIGSRP
jgi:hypothetical protein